MRVGVGIAPNDLVLVVAVGDPQEQSRSYWKLDVDITEDGRMGPFIYVSDGVANPASQISRSIQLNAK
jgi:hypothetical protein